MSEEEILVDLLDEIKTIAFERLGINENSSDKFNFATIDKVDGGINYIEYWVLVNAYYDESINRFVKIDSSATSFGIQLQAKGTYPINPDNDSNTGVIIWRNPRADDVVKDNNKYDYSDWDNNYHIGALRRATNQWETFGVGSGWKNNFITDSKGILNVGGEGIDLDNVSPYGKITSSVYTDGTNNYYLLGVLDNARHPTKESEWTCDDNSKYAWFLGLKYPEANNEKDGSNAKFIVMYNDMSHVNPYDNKHTMNNADWKVILEVSATGIKAIVNGVLTTLTNSGGGGSVDVVDYIEQYEMDAVTSNAVYNGMELKLDKTDAFDGDYDSLINKPSIYSLGGEVTIEKLSEPETGFHSTYVIKQGGTALSPSINIPKDFLVKSATVEKCTVDDNPVVGYRVGDLYIDFVINVHEGVATAEHLYLKVTELISEYNGDNVTIVVENNVISVKPNVFADKIHSHSEYANAVHNHALANITDVSTVTVVVTYADDSTDTIQLVKYNPPTE